MLFDMENTQGKSYYTSLETTLNLSQHIGNAITQENDQNMKHELNVFNFQTIAAATNDFSITNILGKGGFGAVCKAWQLQNEGKGLELRDPTLDESCSPDEVLRCLQVGLLCVQDQAIDRPTMPEVVSMLTNETILLPTPKQPAFYINNTTEESKNPGKNVEDCSINNVTISEMEDR
ncbi:hypothetical protein Patl1_33893 [Pistacia atlantica]|uniref:Uncharacterized protein n=1 Tax=Pistacia atlantica TaxID=434234 RepID=A0ACC0ZVM7_9ROSI|nr:hypothetical protein Patl1_33893 [Pistacia atlantica]